MLNCGYVPADAVIKRADAMGQYGICRLSSPHCHRTWPGLAPWAAPSNLPGAIQIIPKKIGDARGYFAETYSRARFHEAGIAQDWLQDNQSFSRKQASCGGFTFRWLLVCPG